MLILCLIFGITNTEASSLQPQVRQIKITILFTGLLFITSLEDNVRRSTISQKKKGVKNRLFHYFLHRKFKILDCLLSNFIPFYNLHILRIPIDDFLLEITVVAGKGRSCCTETKSSIFYYRLTCTHAVEEVSDVL